MKIIVEALNTANVWQFGSAPELRIYALNDFITDNGQYIPRGLVGTNEPHLKVQCELTDPTTLYIPSFEVDSTPLDRSAFYTAILVTSGRKTPFLSNFAIPPEPSSTSWGSIRLYQQVGRMRFINPPMAEIQTLMSSMIANALLELSFASETNIGGTALTNDPLVPGFPIAVSASDPTWLALGGSSGVSFTPEAFGAIGDGLTDDTVAIQAAIDAVVAAGGGSVLFGAKTYIIAGEFQDILESNAQLLLPRTTTELISIRLIGATPAPTIAFKRAAGTVLKSTLESGNGVMIGGKVGGGAGWPVAGTSWTSVTLENLTVRLPANPTYSGVDLFYYPNGAVRSCQIGTDEDVIAAIGFPPTIGITEPTTPTSFGLRLAPNNIPDQLIVNNVQIYGFSTLLVAGELCNVDNFVGIFGKVGIEIPNALHAQRFGRIYLSDCPTLLSFTGGASYVDFQQLDIEHSIGSPAWAAVVTDIDDPSNFGHGVVRWHISSNGTVINDLVQNGAFYLWTESLGNTVANHSSSPMVQVTKSANQTIPNNAFTNVLFDTNVGDPDPIHNDPFNIHSTVTNTDRFTPSKEGEVEIKFMGRFATDPTGERQVVIWKHSPAGGGVEIELARDNVPAIAGVEKTINLTTGSRATLPGDYFYIQVWQDSGGNLDLVSTVAANPLHFSSPTVFFSQKR